jgi:exodeoxyribonuclease VII small subunit
MSGGTEGAGLEDRLAKLESIVDRLERDELELQEALDLFEEGIGLVRDAYAVIEESRLRVEKLVVEKEGTVTVASEPAAE